MEEKMTSLKQQRHNGDIVMFSFEPLCLLVFRFLRI